MTGSRHLKVQVIFPASARYYPGKEPDALAVIPRAAGAYRFAFTRRLVRST